MQRCTSSLQTQSYPPKHHLQTAPRSAVDDLMSLSYPSCWKYMWGWFAALHILLPITIAPRQWSICGTPLLNSQAAITSMTQSRSNPHSHLHQMFHSQSDCPLCFFDFLLLLLSPWHPPSISLPLYYCAHGRRLCVMPKAS